ncbi:MAG TPA: MBL fold metallo-hydrolase [Bauldia sp.]|nr:MBL fold metallo-hydrolase [Bauldia sp.]
MKISFHGADREVTGSCHLIECAGKRILVDCGMFQGSRDLNEDNGEPFGFDAAAIDVLLLTHAHLDHCGRIPLLAKRGFHGEIIATAATRELARLVMLDSARLQEEDAARRQRHTGPWKKNGGEPPAPLYTVLDAVNVQDRFGRVAQYGVAIDVAPGIRATFIDAGHILGSASIVLDLSENGVARRITMSGDIGNAGRPLMRNHTPPPVSDLVVMETTYGDRNHKPYDVSVEEFYTAIDETFSRGGNVIIPTFALERAQELIYAIHQAIGRSRIAPAVQVFLDSPMAVSATQIFREHPECLSEEAVKLFSDGDDPLKLPGLHLTVETADSIKLNTIRGGAIIMAGSGMATGGRVVHHLRHNIGRREAGIIFVGFAGQGTLARTIIDGAKTVRIMGEELPVKAHVYTINGFSAHAGQAELLEWQKPSQAKRTVLVHGDEQVMGTFGKLLTNTEVIMPKRGDALEL